MPGASSSARPVGTAAHRPDDGGIREELLLLARGLLGAEEQELGAEQPDAGGPALEAGGDLLDELHVAPELDAAAVEGLVGPVGLAGQHLEPRGALGGHPVIPPLRLVVGVEDEVHPPPPPATSPSGLVTLSHR